MPTQNFYDDYTVAGTEISSTYEGRHVTLEESILIHPSHTDTFVEKGDPVVMDEIVGVAFNDAEAATDMIAVDTEGIWALAVLGCISDQTSDGLAHALAIGDRVYINKLTGVLSGQSDPEHWQPFGYALNETSASTTAATVIAVKIHAQFNQIEHIEIGAGSDGFQLEGDVALRQSNWIKGNLQPATLLLTGEQIQGIQVRMEDTLVAQTGSDLTAAEFKVVRNAAATLSSVTGVKVGIDNKVGGIGAASRGMEIVMVGAGSAPAIRSGIKMRGGGTAGTLEAWFECSDSSEGLGLAAGGGGAVGVQEWKIPVLIDGAVHAIPVVAW